MIRTEASWWECCARRSELAGMCMCTSVVRIPASAYVYVCVKERFRVWCCETMSERRSVRVAREGVPYVNSTPRVIRTPLLAPTASETSKCTAAVFFLVSCSHLLAWVSCRST